MKQQYLVFTDMDGTLLDHHTYSHAAAIKTLEQLAKLKIPVIPNTSKTYEEMVVLRQQVALSGPFIVENGAAIHIPHGFFAKKPANTQWLNNHWVRQFTSKKAHWLSLLLRLEKEFSGLFTHFSKMSIEEICQHTGLTQEEAQRAANRQYGEPVLWMGNEQQKAKFLSAITTMGARPLIGGRFIHISGECDKGLAMQWLCNEFKRQYPTADITSIALGDGQNDAAMLDMADIAVRIKSPTNPMPTLNRQTDVYDSESLGPQGWSESLHQILNLTS